MVSGSIGKEKATVVIPAFNASEFIQDAVKSCFCQTYRPIETIVVNDGSTDATERKVTDLAKAIGRQNGFQLRLINIGKNKGAANALKVGFSSAEGTFVSWLSADDIFLSKGKIQKQVETMRKTGADWSYFRDFYQGADISNAKLVRSSYLPHLPILNPLFIRDSDLRLALLIFRNPINGSSVMIEKECLQANGQFDPVTRNVDLDGDLWMRYSALGLKLVAVKGAPVFYRQHPMQTSKRRLDMLYGCELTRIRILMVLKKKGNLTELAKKIVPFLPILIKTNQHICRPLASQFLFNHILDHKKQFDRILLKCIERANGDVNRQVRKLKIDAVKFAEDTETFNKSQAFRDFEKLYI